MFPRASNPSICPCGNGSCAGLNSVMCIDVDCIRQVFNASCSLAFNPNGTCTLGAGFDSIIVYVTSFRAFFYCVLFRGVNGAILSLVDCDRASAPNVAVVLSSGELTLLFYSTEKSSQAGAMYIEIPFATPQPPSTRYFSTFNRFTQCAMLSALAIVGFC